MKVPMGTCSDCKRFGHVVRVLERTHKLSPMAEIGGEYKVHLLCYPCRKKRIEWLEKNPTK